MAGQFTAAKRRFNDGAFHQCYFVGEGLDVGAGDDGLSRYQQFFPIISVRGWDLADGNAQLLPGVPNDSFDFVHSSHCLEHMVDPIEALHNWIRVVRTGGHLVIAVPDEDLYEQGVWPSRFNGDHKWTFTIYKPSTRSWSPVSINLATWLPAFSDVSIERIVRIRDFFRDDVQGDQTRDPNVEAAIEFVLRKL